MTDTLDLNNIQGDILAGLPKKGEIFFFFKIRDNRVQDFCTKLSDLIPLITTVAQCQDDQERIAREKRRASEKHKTPVVIEMSGINIAFSQKGLNKLSITDHIGDSAFEAGMVADAPELGDNLDDWDKRFKQKTQDIHGLILISGSSHPKLEETFKTLKKIFSIDEADAIIEEVIQISGHVRPGDLHGHEHFGYADGISQPIIDDLAVVPHRGQETIHQGIILTGREGDTVQRPTWALDGSFLTFRYLKQRVLEFDDFVDVSAKARNMPGDRFGARLVGRWKSGAPIDLTPDIDNPIFGQSATLNDAFRYHVGQKECPFAAHTRKTNPRSDPELANVGGTEAKRIFRRGIQFGPEVTPSEKASKKSSDDINLERGLLFVCYQSNLANGFQFIQKSWANNAGFPFGKEGVPQPGVDAIISAKPNSQLLGVNPEDLNQPLVLPDNWVIARGGEYLFSPSISALQDTFAQAL